MPFMCALLHCDMYADKVWLKGNGRGGAHLDVALVGSGRQVEAS